MPTTKDFEKLERNPVFKAHLDAIEFNQDEIGDPVPLRLIQGALPTQIVLDERLIIQTLDGLVDLGYIGCKAVSMRRAYYMIGPLDRLARLP